jgi:hypothetical protein
MASFLDEGLTKRSHHDIDRKSGAGPPEADPAFGKKHQQKGMSGIT